jgi:HTH-type transcriptional regulator, quorum sensing regulator NprR
MLKYLIYGMKGVVILLGKKIKEARNELGISQNQLAGEDITRAYISILEKGHAKPSEKTLRIIAQRLGKPMEYFLGDNQEDNIEICGAILERVKLKKTNEEFDAALSILSKVFPMTQDSQILAEAYLLELEINLELKEYSTVLDKGDEAKTIFTELKEKSYLVQYYMMMGKVSFKIENFKDSKKYYELALTYSKQIKKLQFERINCHIFLGTTYLRLGNIPNAIDSYENAASEVSVTNYTDLKGDINLGLGKAYFISSLTDKAITYTKRAVEFYSACSDEQKVYALNNLVIMENSIGNTDRAFEILKTCYEIYKKKNLYVKQASVLEELSILSLKKNDIKQARYFCDKGIKVLEKEDSGILRARLYRLMGVILRSEDKQNESYYLLRMSYDLLIRLQSHHEASYSLELLNIYNKTDIKDVFLEKLK